MNNDKAIFQSCADVSRETMDRLEVYADLLIRWTKKINLVSPSTLTNLWQRHFLDSAQLLPFVDDKKWLDVGSGGGFPGAVLAIMSPKASFTLVESDQRKATFLRTVSRETGADFQVLSERIEAIEPENADRMTARALAPLPDLLKIAERHLHANGRAFFLKGANVQHEINQALDHWTFDCETYPSKTNEDSVILSIGNIKRV